MTLSLSCVVLFRIPYSVTIGCDACVCAAFAQAGTEDESLAAAAARHFFFPGLRPADLRFVMRASQPGTRRLAAGASEQCQVRTPSHSRKGRLSFQAAQLEGGGNWELGRWAASGGELAIFDIANLQL